MSKIFYFQDSNSCGDLVVQINLFSSTLTRDMNLTSRTLFIMRTDPHILLHVSLLVLSVLEFSHEYVHYLQNRYEMASNSHKKKFVFDKEGELRPIIGKKF